MRVKTAEKKIQEGLKRTAVRIADLTIAVNRLSGNVLNQPDPPDRSWLKDYSKLAHSTIMKNYSLADVRALIPFSQPNYVGPLFYTLLNGISIMSRLCYGFSHPKRSFIKFLNINMKIDSPCTDFLYQVYKSIHLNGVTWCSNSSIGSGFIDNRPFRVYNKKIVDINVIELANRYIEALEELDTEDLKNEMPVFDNREIVQRVIKYLERSQNVSKS